MTHITHDHLLQPCCIFFAVKKWKIIRDALICYFVKPSVTFVNAPSPTHKAQLLLLIAVHEIVHSFYRPTEGRRLSRPGWLANYN